MIKKCDNVMQEMTYKSDQDKKYVYELQKEIENNEKVNKQRLLDLMM